MRRFAVMTLALAAWAVRVGAQPVDLDRVLSLTSAYLLEYEKQLSAVVAEEHYEQWIDVARASTATSTGRMRESSGERMPTKRSLVSDFLMIRWPGEAAWFGFRDVLSVDGTPVRDREQRLLALFTQKPDDVLSRADLIAAESARYNIGGVARNINVPTQALDFLHPRHRNRFRFQRTGEDTIEGARVWRIAFEEREPPYLIATPSGRGVRARGSAWITPGDGAIVQTQLDLTIAEARHLLRTRITATFRYEASLGLRVPAELVETHEQSDPTSRVGAGTVLGGRAQYRNFRRFGTEVDEKLAR